MSGPLDTLRAAYADPLAHAREVAAGGARVVGYTAPDAPAELFAACGLYPVLILPRAPIANPLTEAYLADTDPWDIKAMIERLVDGACRDLALVVVSRPHEWLYYMAKEFVRTGAGRSIPPLQMFDLIHQHETSLNGYNRAQFDALAARAAAAGYAPTPDSLDHAARSADRRREAIGRVLQLRDAGQINGTTAIEVIGAGFVIEADRYADLVDLWVGEIGDRPSTYGGRLLLVTSEPTSTSRLHGAIEASGAIVVAEDSWCGSRAVVSAEDGVAEPMDRLYRSAMSIPVGEVSPREVREAWLLERLAAGGQDGVVFHMPQTDRQLGWDYPRLKARCDALGLPSLSLRDSADADDLSHITECCREFLAKLPTTKGASHVAG